MWCRSRVGCWTPRPCTSPCLRPLSLTTSSLRPSSRGTASLPGIYRSLSQNPGLRPLSLTTSSLRPFYRGTASLPGICTPLAAFCAPCAYSTSVLPSRIAFSVGDPDPQDPHVFGLPDPDQDPLVRGTDPDPSLFS
jgi:hypothetical protein